jgi:Fe2+ or Zn2+ uptake regulation protein
LSQNGQANSSKVINLKNNIIIMRGRSIDYSFLDSMVLTILKESSIPMQALGISFRINEKTDKIISLSAVKNCLNTLVEKKKIFENEKKDGTIYYRLK